MLPPLWSRSSLSIDYLSEEIFFVKARCARSNSAAFSSSMKPVKTSLYVLGLLESLEFIKLSLVSVNVSRSIILSLDSVGNPVSCDSCMPIWPDFLRGSSFTSSFLRMRTSPRRSRLYRYEKSYPFRSGCFLPCLRIRSRTSCRYAFLSFSLLKLISLDLSGSLGNSRFANFFWMTWSKASKCLKRVFFW